MGQDKLFDETSSRASDFEFNEEVVAVFDDMISRSVPFYKEQQYMVREIAGERFIPGTRIYDLGCSTATTLINLCAAIPQAEALIGYDNSRPMIDNADLRIRAKGFESRIKVLQADLNDASSDLSLENASVVTMCWTLQFVRPMHRDRVIRLIHDGLVKGGVLVLTEKVLTRNQQMNRFFIDRYYSFKKRNGYSETEIMRKREALENVLIPYTLEENVELFRRNGFRICETFFQWYNFVGFLCVKSGS